MKALRNIGSALAFIGIGVLISTAVGMHLGLMAVGLAALAVGALLAFIGRDPDEDEEEVYEIMEDQEDAQSENAEAKVLPVLRR